MKGFLNIFPFLMLILLNGCSDPDPQAETDQKNHVWKSQTDAIEKAKGVENLILDSAAEQQRAIDRETR